jgi:TrmH family RNA methyltransferase
MVITSKENENIKYIKKLKEKKYRDMYREYIVEGTKIIHEAISENMEIKTIVICDDCIKRGEFDAKTLYEIAKYNCVYVDSKVFDTITDVQTPQGILAVITKKKEVEEIKYKDDVIVILDDIQDPGNLGTILRTVDSVRFNPNNYIKK